MAQSPSLAGFLGDIGGRLKGPATTVGRYGIAAANALERLLGGSGVASVSLAQKLGLAQDTPKGAASTITPGGSPVSDILNLTPFNIAPVSGQQVGTQQLAQAPATSIQTPQPGAPLVSPSALNQMSSGSERVPGRAAVPTAPSVPSAGSTPERQVPQLRQPQTGTGTMEALIRALANVPGRKGTPGFVSTPDATPIGGGMRRRIVDQNQPQG